MREPVGYRETIELLDKRAKENGITGICITQQQAAKLTGVSRQYLAKQGLTYPISLAKLARVICQ